MISPNVNEPAPVSWRTRLPAIAVPGWGELGVRLWAWVRARPARLWAARWCVAGSAVLWLPIMVYFLGNRPGFMTFDSFEVWRQASTGQWEDTHSIAYVIAMKAAQIINGGPAVLTLAQTMFMAGAIAALARALVRFGTARVPTYLIALLLSMTPMVDGFTIALWKDVPFSAGMLCVAARVVDLIGARLKSPGVPVPLPILYSLFRWALVVVLFRQNGVFFTTYLGFLLLAVATRRRREIAALTVALGVFFLAMKLVLYPVIGVEKTPEEITLAGFVHDINAALTRNPELFTQADYDLLAQAMPINEWLLSRDHPFGCYAIIPWYLNPTMNVEAFRGHTAEYRALWRKILVHAPATIIANRWCVGAIAWRPHNTGTYTYTLTYGISENDYGFAIDPIVPSFHDWTIKRLQWIDEPHHLWFTWRAPAFIYFVYAIVTVQALVRRRLVWLAPGAVLLAQQLNVLTLNPSQDARYMFGSYMVSVMMFSLAFYRRPRVLPGPPADD